MSISRGPKKIFVTEQCQTGRCYRFSGYFGTGLVILSKEPIMESLFLPYPLNGYVHHLHTGNYFVGVGVGLVRISINSLTVSVYCSHVSFLLAQE